MSAGPERMALQDEIAVAEDGARRSVIRLLVRHPLGAPCLAFLVLVVLVAIFAPLLAPYGPQETDLDAVNAPPFTAGHFLGGDSAGLDILSRLIWGSRQTVLAVLIVVVVALILGVATGLVAGFYRGRFDSAAGFFSDVVMSLPGIVLLIALYALTGPNVPAAMAVYGVIIAPSYYRLVRAIVLGVRNELYVEDRKSVV